MRHGITKRFNYHLYVIADPDNTTTHPGSGQHNERPNFENTNQQNRRFSAGTSIVPQTQHCHNFRAVAPILEALEATQVFGINRVNDNQKITVELFVDVCKNQGLPLELTNRTATAYLLFLSQMNYSATSVRYRWNPIFKMCEVKNIVLTNDTLDLYDFVKESACEIPDKKIPVSHILLQQQLKAIDKFLIKGYENTMVKAVLCTAWAGQLRVSEYTSKRVAYINAGHDHNLGAGGIVVQDDGITIIFMSKKTSRKRRECFIDYATVPIPEFKAIMQAYDKICMKNSPVFFCWPDGSNITPNNVANWIQLATLWMDWQGLVVTSHCYRIGGTSYLYRAGIDMAKLHRSSRWAKDDAPTVEHYLKPGLYSMDPQQIYEKLQYRKTFKAKNLIFLRDQISTKGGSQHEFNTILTELGHANLVRLSYPTPRCEDKIKKLHNAVSVNKYLEKVQAAAATCMDQQFEKDQVSVQFRKEFCQWKAAQICQKNANYKRFTQPCPDAELPNLQRLLLDQAQAQLNIANAKTQALSVEIKSTGSLAVQLQAVKSDLIIAENELSDLKKEIVTKNKELEVQKFALKKTRDELAKMTEERNSLLQKVGESLMVTKSTQHKQVRTRLKGEDPHIWGRKIKVSKDVLQKIARKRRKRITKKYVDPMGEERIDPLDKLRDRVYGGIHKKLSKHHRIRRTYTSASNKKDWICEPSAPRKTRSTSIKVNSTFYNCCKYGIEEWPETDHEMDSENTDIELLEELEEQGHSHDFRDYRTVYPILEVWTPFLDAKKNFRPPDSQAKAIQIKGNFSGQLACASKSEKIDIIQKAANDNKKLCTVLKVLKAVPESFHGKVPETKIKQIVKQLSSNR